MEGTQTPPKRRLELLLLGLAYASLPFLAVTFVPSTDLPQHLAQIRMLDEKWGLSPPTIDLSATDIRLFGANTLVYVPMFVLARVFPLLLAGKLTVALLLLASVAALHALAKVLQRDPLHALVAGMLFFGLPLYWGFLNFLCGLPLFLWLLCYALRSATQVAAWREGAILASLMLGLFWAHVLWLPAAGLALVVGALVCRPDSKMLLARALSVVPAGVLALGWYPTLAAARAEAGFDTQARYLITLMDRLSAEWWVGTLFGGVEGWLEAAATTALLAYAIAAWWAGRTSRERRDRGLLCLGLLFIAFALLAPDMYMNTILFGRRFLAVGAILVILALPGTSRGVAWGAAAVTGLFSVCTTMAWALYDQDELDGLREALALVDEPKSVLGLNHRPTSDLMRGNPFLQTFAYFQVLHGGEVNFSFAEHASSIVAYKTPRKVNWQGGLEWFPQYVTEADLAAFDCVLVNGTEAQHQRFARYSGLRTPQERGYFRLYCHAFGREQVTTGVPR